MPVTIPSPISAPPQRQKRQNPIETLLLGLTGQAGSLGLQSLLSPGIAGATESARQGAVTAGATERAQSSADIAAGAEAAQAALRKEAHQRGRTILSRAESIEQDGVQIDIADKLVSAFDLAFFTKEAGQGDSIINSFIEATLPPDQTSILAEQKTRLDIVSAQDSQAADAAATKRLIEMGVVQDGTAVIPGSSNTLLRLIESKDAQEQREKVNFFQEGIDFITGRIGDPVSGSQFAIVNGQTVPNPNPSGGAVTVEQAIAEYKSMIEQFLTPEQSKSIIARLNSGAGQRAITVGAAVDGVVDLFKAGGDDSEVKASFAGVFTPVEVAQIITRARRRIDFPR